MLKKSNIVRFKEVAARKIIYNSLSGDRWTDLWELDEGRGRIKIQPRSEQRGLEMKRWPALCCIFLAISIIFWLGSASFIIYAYSGGINASASCARSSYGECCGEAKKCLPAPAAGLQVSISNNGISQRPACALFLPRQHVCVRHQHQHTFAYKNARRRRECRGAWHSNKIKIVPYSC